MASVLLPQGTEPISLWQYLWDEHKIEAMITTWREESVLRLGFNAYNAESELEMFLGVIKKYLGKAGV